MCGQRFDSAEYAGGHAAGTDQIYVRIYIPETIIGA